MTLLEYIKSDGVSLTSFAEKCGTSTGYMHDLANRRRTPSLPLALDIVRKSGGNVKIDGLVGDNVGNGRLETKSVKMG